MLVGASYAAAHDHDDHAVDYESECLVCGVASLGGAKLPSAEPLIVKPSNHSDQTSNQNAVAPHLLIAAYQTARGPPLLSRQL